MRLKIIALIMVLLFSIGIITSCSNNNEAEKSSTAESKTSSVVTDDDDLDDADDEDDFDWEDALDEVVSLLEEKTNQDDDEIENKINYKILPSKNGDGYFVRYFLEDSDSDDALVFTNGKIYLLSTDGKSKFTEYKNKFSVDITNVTDDELLKQKDCISGGFGAEFD